jgi:uncharacterized protein YjeT (DUF2065 family)
MVFWVKLIGVFVISVGLCGLLNPKFMKSLIDILVREEKIYFIGFIRIFLGLVMYIASTNCRMPVVINVIGIFVILKGMILFILDFARIKSMASWWQRRSMWTLRLTTLVIIAIGMLIVYAA